VETSSSEHGDRISRRRPDPARRTFRTAWLDRTRPPARLPDPSARSDQATTLGVGALLLASAIFFSSGTNEGISLHELAILFFLFITAPVTAHLLAKAALHRQTGTQQSDSGTPVSGRDGEKLPHPDKTS
jgi:monovalent cation/proton antiporter MnhG/PhaG subunit